MMQREGIRWNVAQQSPLHLAWIEMEERWEGHDRHGTLKAMSRNLRRIYFLMNSLRDHHFI